jgi:hypothetical protein
MIALEQASDLCAGDGDGQACSAEGDDNEMGKLPDNLTKVAKTIGSGAALRSHGNILFSPTPPSLSRRSPIFVGHPLGTNFNWVIDTRSIEIIVLMSTRYSLQ